MSLALKSKNPRISYVIFFFFALVIWIQFMFPTFVLRSSYLHGLFDGFTGATSFFLGFCLILIRPYRANAYYLSIVALAFLCIGIVNLGVLISQNSNVSSWLDLFSLMIGALTFSLLWLPPSIAEKLFCESKTSHIVAVSSIVAFLVALTLLNCDFFIATHKENRDFIPIYRYLMIASGVTYFIVIPRIRKVIPGSETPFIESVTLFFALTAFTWSISKIWGPKWWFSQIAQSVPFAYGISLALKSFLNNQKSLFISETRFRALFEEAPVGVAIVNQRENFFYKANPALCNLLGYHETELRKLKLADLTHPDDMEKTQFNQRRLLCGEISSFQTVKRYLRKDKSPVWVKVYGALAHLGQDQIEEIRIIEDISSDIDNQKKIEKLIADLTRTNQELEKFAAIASHDLKSPLNSISSFAHLISERIESSQDSTLKGYVQFVIDASQRMRELVNDLLDYATVSRNNIVFSKVDCNIVMKRVMHNLSAEILSAKAKVTFTNLPFVLGDETQLGQVMQNLIANSLKYRGDIPPKVSVSAEDKGEEYVFSFTDNGIGFSMEYAETIFVEFKRLHGQGGAYSGTGLGLPICKTIIERHGGRIWASSVQGKGSTFHFTLPKPGLSNA